MKRFLIKALVFIAVAVGTAFLVNQFNNRGLDRVSRELDEPTLPYVYLEFEGKSSIVPVGIRRRCRQA